MARGNIRKELLFHSFTDVDRLGLFSSNYQTPEYLKFNLKDELRYYQEEALRYLHYAQESSDVETKYKHLLFHMATGSGKTMVMAGAILYLFKEHGYQNFLFFVHTDAIIQKTRENLINDLSSKYLFNQPLELAGERVIIEPVDNFPLIAEKNTIYLKLSTIHKIHDELNNYKENCITYEDLEQIPLILLGDEAHHFNASTRGRTVQEISELTWERTISRILHINKKNRLFEFTATINLNNKEIYNKYKDKIIYQYDLKRFMLDGFSKKVMLLQANQSDDDKMLDAVLLSQYRKLIALEYGIYDFKPVVLFKSPQIAVSQKKQEEFIELINNLTPNTIKQHLEQKKLQLNASSVWYKVMGFYDSCDLIKVVSMIKEDFNEMNLLNVNKADLMEEHPVLLNTLEEINNPIRAVFAVAKVNEGWDVLNLYDIVRISESAAKTKNSTDSEAQLIGRGARYYPFEYHGEKSYTRRFDVSSNVLNILEQMHYHTINETDYIANLHQSLEQTDIIVEEDGVGTLVKAALKSDFKRSNIYRNGKVYFNEITEITGNERSWASYSLEKNFEITYKTISEKKLENLSNEQKDILKTEILKLDKRFWNKAIQKINFYRFDNLKKYFPNLASVEEFITDTQYLGGLSITVNLPNSLGLNVLMPKEKLNLLEEVLTNIAENLRRNYKKYSGTYNFISKQLNEVFTDYSIVVDNQMVINQRITYEPTIGKKWYVYDQAILNQLEHRLVRLIGKFIEKLQTKYDQIYLIRNDEMTTRFKLVEFSGVRGFMPDFIMLMTDKADNSYYQVFIEPKGGNRVSSDAWKEQMLETINDKQLITISENDDVRLVGIKFYSDEEPFTHKRDEFIKDFEEKLFDGKPLDDVSLIFD